MSQNVGSQGNNVWFPKSKGNRGGYFDTALNRHFTSKQQKVEHMKAHGLQEDGSMESERARSRRVVQQVNADREKRGQKPKTAAQILGNGPHAKYVRKYF